jgi:hypothetical protein
MKAGRQVTQLEESYIEDDESGVGAINRWYAI